MTTPTQSRPGWLARLRTPKPADIVHVTFTGTPAAVTTVARALAAVTVVTGMRHTPTTDAVIRLDATCHAATAGGGR